MSQEHADQVIDSLNDSLDAFRENGIENENLTVPLETAIVDQLSVYVEALCQLGVDAWLQIIATDGGNLELLASLDTTCANETYGLRIPENLYSQDSETQLKIDKEELLSRLQEDPLDLHLSKLARIIVQAFQANQDVYAQLYYGN